MDPSMDDPMSEEDEYLDYPPGGGDSDSGSGKGVVVEGVEIAEEDVYAYGDPDDPLDRVLDVYLADDLEDHLYLLQYPMRPADRQLTTPLAVKVKAANHLLEVEHAIKQGGKHFDKHAPAQLRQATQIHTGSRVRPATNFAFGVIRSDEFHLTPVHATMQMRPCFQHIDKAKALEIEMDLDDPDNGGTKVAERPQQVSFKKKESERATAARKSTYAYKKSIEDAEPWVPLEVYGQNDEHSLDEFGRMFVDTEDDGGGGGGAAKRSTTVKEFPPCERYLQGLDYMEEYDENGESYSAGIRGRSLDESVDLAAAGSALSSGGTSSTPVQQLRGDAKIVAYLKLAHLVPFTMLLDVTKMPPDAVMQALSAEGRQKGLLVRGNWAARAKDVWAQGPPDAANCLSVVQYLLHQYGAVSRPDLQRRFPDMDPLVLKTVLSHIAELDTIHRRWLPKLKDGIAFGMEHPEIVEIEEERWTLQQSRLKELLGEDILAPPSCPTFEPFVKVLAAATDAAAMASASMARSRLSAPRSVPPFGHLRRGGDTTKPQRLEGAEAARPGSSGEDADVEVPDLVEMVAPKGKGKASQAPPGAEAEVGDPKVEDPAPAPATRRHFKPKKRPAKTVAATTATVGLAGKETAIKQEHGNDAHDGEGGSEGAGAGAGAGAGHVTGSEDVAVAPQGGEDGMNLDDSDRGSGTGLTRRDTTAASASDSGAGSFNGDAVADGEDISSPRTTKKRAATSRGAATGSVLPAAKEEPRESSTDGTTFKGTERVGATADDLIAIKDEGQGEGASVTAAAQELGKDGLVEAEGIATKSTRESKAGGASSKPKEEPVVRPKIRPRAKRTKPKGK